MYHDLTWQLVTDRQRRYRRESTTALPPAMTNETRPRWPTRRANRPPG